MNLTPAQLEAVMDGEPVRVSSPEAGMDLVVLRADVSERVRGVFDESLTRGQVGRLIASGMEEYDADDPLLDSYQKYRS